VYQIFVMYLVKEDKLFDENGEYELSEVYEHEIIKQNEILKIISIIRKDPSLLENCDLPTPNY